jgi:hypothetical protein
MFPKWLDRISAEKTIAVMLAVVLLGMATYYAVPRFTHNAIAEMNDILTMGTSTVQAAGVADATADGTNDNVEAQALVTALPATGGRLYILTGTYVWANLATVTDASPNITIEGTGDGTYLTGDGVTAQFTAGGNGWKLKNLRVNVTTAVLLTAMGATTGWSWEGVRTSDGYFDYRSDEATMAASWNIPTGRGATYVVAASDATATEKAQADYVCDGTADDVEIQAAFTALSANGGCINFSSGTFNISTTILLTRDSTTIRGQGTGNLAISADNGTMIYLSNGSNCDMIANSDATKRLLIIGGLTLNGNKNNQASGNGINIDNINLYTGGAGLDLEIVYTKNNGIYSNAASANQAIHGSGLYIVGCGDSGIYCTNGAQGSEISLPNWLNANGGYGCYIWGGTDYNLEIVAEGNTLDGIKLGMSNSMLDLWSISNQKNGVFLNGSNNNVRVHAHNNALATAADAELSLQNTAGSVYTVDLHNTNTTANAVGLAVSGTVTGTTVTGSIYGKEHGVYTVSLVGQINLCNSSITSGNHIISSFFGGGWHYTAPFDPLLILRNNIGFIDSGEVRTASGSLTPTGVATATTVTGTFTESPLALKPGANVMHCTVNGTANIVMPAGSTAVVTSIGGGATVTDDPKTCPAGATTLITVTAGGTNDFTITVHSNAFAWHNPELQDIFIKKIVINRTAAGGTATAEMNVGIADNGTVDDPGTEFFNNMLVNNAAAIHDSYVAGGTSYGTQTIWVNCQDSASATGGWVVGKIDTEIANSLAGSWYIEFVGK